MIATGSGRRWLLPALLIALIAALVAVLVIVLSGGGSSTHRVAGAPAGVPSARTRTHQAPGKTVRRLVLIGSASSHKAFGTGVVVSQHGNLLLLLQARGLAPNHHDSYGVWLYNSPRDARLLGFVPRPVGTNGTFTSSVILPGEAGRFHSLIVTLEHSQLPKTPGTTVLRSPLSLP